LGAIFKFILLFLGGVYLLRLISPFLFKMMLTSFIKKSQEQNEKNTTSTPPKKSKSPSDTLGEYVDYEELD